MSDTEGVREEVGAVEKNKIEEIKNKVTAEEPAVKALDADVNCTSKVSTVDTEPEKEIVQPSANSVRFDDTPQIFEDDLGTDDKDLENGSNEAEYDRNNVVNDDEDDECRVEDEELEEEFDEEEEGGRSHGSSSAESLVPDTERELGDGQESEKKDKKSDQGEDRRDPQYIPKRGVFYEHDDRTLEEDSEATKEPVREPKKNKAFEAVEKWGHDLYDESDQSPKSTEELIDIYGYDIRNEEAPPKARRRRRYGKGPNKYQRSWEDEQAYNKTPTRGGYRGRRVPRNFVQQDEDFPQLPSKPQQPQMPENEVITGSNVTNSLNNDSNEGGINREALKLGIKFPQVDNLTSKEDVKGRRPSPGDKSAMTHDRPERSRSGSGKRGYGGRGGSHSTAQGPPFRGGARSGRPHGNHHFSDADKRGGKGGSTADEDIATLAQHFSNAVINIDKNIAPIRSQSEAPTDDRPNLKEDAPRQPASTGAPHSPVPHHTANAPSKHHQSSEAPSTRSKRYSTQRHRPQQPMPSGGQAVPGIPPPAQAVPQLQATQAPQPTMPGAPAPNYLPPQPGYYPPQHGMCPPPVPSDNPGHLAGPPAQFPPPPGGMQMVTYLPGVPPPPANTFQPPPNIPTNIYVPSAQYIPPPPIVQPTPSEVYQGGVTYYNTQSQQVTRAVPSRRVKLAIPIVAPDSSQPIQ